MTRLFAIISALRGFSANRQAIYGRLLSLLGTQSHLSSCNLGTAGSGRSSRFSKGRIPGSGFAGAALIRGTFTLLAAMLFSVTPAAAATPGGTRISNTATATTGNGPVVITSNIAIVMVRSAATIEFLKYAPILGSADQVTVPVMAYQSASGTFIPITAPPETATQPVPLQTDPVFHAGETIYLRLTDPDQNREPAAAENVLVKVVCNDTGDTEVLRLTETAPDSGVFTGYLPSAGSGAAGRNGQLLVAIGGKIIASYTDAADESDYTAATTMVDPLGIVFDSRTGAPLNGAVVTLVNAATGLPATVYGDDGVSIFPATISSGGTAVDSGGTAYSFPAGGFRFPYVTPGSYELQVTPPGGYTIPSSATDAALQALPGAPFALATGSRGEIFTVNPGPVVQIDIPVDPAAAKLWLSKEADRDLASVGDFLQYHLTLENTDEQATAAAVTVSDRLPLGFRYQEGSARLNGAKVSDPAISADGRQLTFAVGNVPPGAQATIRYVIEVAAGTKTGDAINQAQAADSGGGRSNLAQAKVKVHEAFFRDTTFLLGRVLTGECHQDDATMGGVPGVRIYLEDGTYVVSDDAGRFHFEGVAPGVHVVQLDLDTLPPGYEALLCQGDSRFAGRSFSQLVDLQGGSLWQTNFYLAPKPLTGQDGSFPEGASVAAQVAGTLDSPIPALPGNLADSGQLAPAQRQPLDSPEAEAPALEGIKAPADGAHLAHQVMQVQIVLDSRLTPRLMLDGQELAKERIGFSTSDPQTRLTAYNYVGIDFGGPGTHVLTLEGIDPFGNVRYNATSNVIRTGKVRQILQIPGPENIADGISPVVVKLRVEDQAREAVAVPIKMQLTGGSLAPYQPKQASMRTPDDPDADLVEVAQDGTVKFAAVTQAGRHTATLVYGDIEVSIETWLKPAPRDWILVGFAEGTVGYHTISDNLVSAAAAGIDEHGYSDGQVKFFAKGAIKGEWLLTLAYDSDKPDFDGDSLQQIIDPDTYYPLYGDETQQGYEAASAENLYVKLERDQFYALFGDMQTGLTQTVLSHYSRSMNGFKSELQEERFAYTVFAADTKQAFVKDELRGDGTSGRYPLSQQSLVINSEEVVIEIRDRFHNERIVKEERLARHIDYDIDYDAGTLYFKRPVPSKDQDFNPVFIVVRYETKSSDQANFNYGGRAAVKLLDQQIEVGASLVHEESGAAEGDLYGTDVTMQLTPQTTLRAEMATTDVTELDDDRQGDAYLAEIEHLGTRLDGHAWFRQQDPLFGLGQQDNGTEGMRTYGVEGAYRVTPRWSLAGELYHEDNLTTDAQRDVGELAARYRNERYGLLVGLRDARDRFDDGATERSRQMLFGGDWTRPDRKLTLRATHEQSLGQNDENADYPTRTMFGVDYQLSQRVSLFAEQEFTWSDQADTEGTRVGLKATPWQGGEVHSSVEQQIDENSQRIFALFGVGQSWQFTRHWSVDASIDRSYTVKNKQSVARVNPNVPPASGGDEDFTAASVGATYRAETWSWWNRLEVRQGDSEDKVGISSGLVNELRQGLATSARLMAFMSDVDGDKSDEEELRLGLAYRPSEGHWILLERLDLEHDHEDYADGSDNTSWQIVNHLHANYRASRKWQTSCYYGLKYLRETFDGDRYDGFTDMLAAETRYSIDTRWDIGVNGATLHSWNSKQCDFSAGASVGFLAMANTWISVGYNVAGFEDDDFSEANYTAEGPFIRFRVKFDQQSVKEVAEWLNR